MSSPASRDGLVFADPSVSFTLRAQASASSAALVKETAVAGFGAMRQLTVLVDVVSVSLTGGTSPTAKLQAWIQRTPDNGTTWDDLLAVETDAFANAAAAKQFVGEYSARHGSVGAAAAVQDAGGTPPIAQRGAWLSDKLRTQWKLVLTGSPATVAVTFSVKVEGRP